VTLDADVIHQRKPLYLKEEQAAAANGSGARVYPARITRRWVLLDRTWFIKSVTILQYL